MVLCLPIFSHFKKAPDHPGRPRSARLEAQVQEAQKSVAEAQRKVEDMAKDSLWVRESAGDPD